MLQGEHIALTMTKICCCRAALRTVTSIFSEVLRRNHSSNSSISITLSSIEAALTSKEPVRRQVTLSYCCLQGSGRVDPHNLRPYTIPYSSPYVPSSTLPSVSTSRLCWQTCFFAIVNNVVVQMQSLIMLRGQQLQNHQILRHSCSPDVVLPKLKLCCRWLCTPTT